MARKLKTTPKTKARAIPDDPELVFDTLRATKGNVAKAATTLGCKTYTLHYWINSDEGRRETLDLIRIAYDDELIDLALTALEKSLRSTDGRVRNAAINTAFKYMGKGRGYVPAHLVANNNTDDITIEVIRK